MKLKSLFSSKTSTPDGIRVVTRSAQSTTLEQRMGSEINVIVVPRSDEISLNAVVDGNRSTLTVGFANGKEWKQGFASEQHCRDAQEILSRSLSRFSYSWRQAALSVLIGLAVVLLITPTPATSVAPNQVSAVAEPQPQTPAASTLNPVEMGKLFAAQVSSGLNLGKGGKPFVVFSDPNCPFCRELEKSLAQLDSALNPVILPLGFKEGARDLSASVLCSKDPVAAWKAYMRDGKKPGAQVCQDGLAKVDANMALFRELQLGSTPTLVSPSGVVVVGSGTPEAIRMVMSN